MVPGFLPYKIAAPRLVQPSKARKSFAFQNHAAATCYGLAHAAVIIVYEAASGCNDLLHVYTYPPGPLHTWCLCLSVQLLVFHNLIDMMTPTIYRDESNLEPVQTPETSKKARGTISHDSACARSISIQ
jgi:hypothetical protein